MKKLHCKCPKCGSLSISINDKKKVALNKGEVVCGSCGEAFSIPPSYKLFTAFAIALISSFVLLILFGFVGVVYSLISTFLIVGFVFYFLVYVAPMRHK